MSEINNTDIYGVKEKEQDYYAESMENKRHGIKKSSFYHRYFEGYAEFQKDVAFNKTKIERIYVAPYKMQDISGKERIARKTLYGIATIVAIALFIYAGTRAVLANIFWFGAFLGSIQTISMIIFTASCIRYLFYKKNMTVYQMKTVEYFSRIALVCAVVFLTMSVFAFLCENINIGIMYLINAGIMLTVYIIEKKTTFVDVENVNRMPQNGTYIR